MQSPLSMLDSTNAPLPHLAKLSSNPTPIGACEETARKSQWILFFTIFPTLHRSWAVAGADSTWGGPAHCRTGIHPVDKSDLSPKAFVPAQELYNTPTSMEADSNVVTKICSSHQPFWSGFDYNWDNLETPLSQTQRLKDTVLYLSSLHSSNETIALCSHGGPCYHIYEALTGEHYSKEGPCGYTAISVFSPPKHGDGEIWKVSKTKQNKTKLNEVTFFMHHAYHAFNAMLIMIHQCDRAITGLGRIEKCRSLLAVPY